MRGFRTAFGAIDLVERALVAVGLVMLLAIMCIVMADVAMRYLLNQPIWWSYEIIGIYLMSGIFFLLLSRTFAAGAHISVDLLKRRLAPSARHLVDAFCDLVCAAVFALGAYATFLAARGAYVDADTLTGSTIPTWPAIAFAPIGLALLTARLLLHCCAEIASTATGQDIVATFQPADAGLGVHE